MKFKNIYLCALSFLAMTMSSNAAYLSPSDALQRALGQSTAKHVKGDVNYYLSCSESLDGEDLIYIFNAKSDGFIVVSADDKMPAVLGYSGSGSIDEDNMPPQLKWWLGQYAEECIYLPENAITLQSGNDTRASKSEVQPLISTTWGQDYPYNTLCPDNCVTGCVATAMAQIIKYHNYPSNGAGQHSYSWNGRTLTFDFGNANFDFSDMLDSYSGLNATQFQKDAVAKLMYACGVAVDMDYGINDSGASDVYIESALKNYFNYDKGVRYLMRNCFLTEEWDEIIYEEIAHGRPVVYGGQSAYGDGHQFILDGYSDGYYHINWGWNGLGDGYFLLTALNPEFQGIGGSSGGFNTSQTATIGIQPPTAGTHTFYNIYAGGSLVLNTVLKNQFVSVSFQDSGIHNYSKEDVTVSFYLKSVSRSGEEYFSNNGLEVAFTGVKGNSISGYASFSPIEIPKNMPEGEYKTYLVFKKPDGEWQNVGFPTSCAAYSATKVNAKGDVSFEMGLPLEKATIRMTKFEPTSIVEYGIPTPFNVSIDNIGDIEFNGTVAVKIFEHDTFNELDEKLISAAIPAGSSLNGYVSLTFELKDGIYDVVAYDSYGDKISDTFTLRIGESSVDNILDENIEESNVYTLEGTLVLTNADRSKISALPKGMYFVCTKKGSCKILNK